MIMGEKEIVKDDEENREGKIGQEGWREEGRQEKREKQRRQQCMGENDKQRIEIGEGVRENVGDVLNEAREKETEGGRERERERNKGRRS